jgi:hypothetical protein
MEGSAPITGGCLCGRVRFELSEPLLGAEYCHCRRCQRRTGTAFSISALAAPGSFRVTEGKDSLGAFEPPDGWRKVFCRECGAHLYAQSPDDRGQVCVRMGAIDGDPGVRSSVHQFVASAAPWGSIPEDGLPRFDQRMPDDFFG